MSKKSQTKDFSENRLVKLFHQNKLPYVLHGSSDSLDRDIIYIFPYQQAIPFESPFLSDLRYLPTQRECHEFCHEFNGFQTENRNIITIHPLRGLVMECYKGTNDAINNQIFYTFANHKQDCFPTCPVARLVRRNVVLKATRSLRQMLVFASMQKGHMAEECKQVLKQRDFLARLQVFKRIDFTLVFVPRKQQQQEPKASGKGQARGAKSKASAAPSTTTTTTTTSVVEEKEVYKLDVDALKSLAFQLAQTKAQVEGQELYSKKGTVEYDNRLHPFLYRDTAKLLAKDELGNWKTGMYTSVLNEYRDWIYEALAGVNVIKSKSNPDLVIFLPSTTASGGATAGSKNEFMEEANGMIIDAACERCLFSGWTRSEEEQWHQAKIEARTASLGTFVSFICVFKYKEAVAFATKTAFDGDEGIPEKDRQALDYAKQMLQYEPQSPYLIAKLHMDEFDYLFGVFQSQEGTKRLQLLSVRDKLINELVAGEEELVRYY